MKQTIPSEVRRQFEAAKTNRFVDGWVTQPAPIDSWIRRGLRTLRARSREQAVNSDYIRSYLRLLKNNVVGNTGFQLQGRVTNRFDDQMDADANTAIETAWKRWGKYGVCDVTGTKSWNDVEKEFITGLARDGEVLIRLVRNWDLNDFRFAVQVIDPELLDINLSASTDKRRSNEIIMGVEMMPEWRRAVAYHVNRQSVRNTLTGYETERRDRFPKEEMLHRFLPEFSFQTRGFPLTCSAMLRLNMLEGYEDAELVASTYGANKLAIMIRPPGSDSTGIGNSTVNEDTGEEFQIEEVEPGIINEVPHGTTLADWNPTHPTNAYDAFMTRGLRGAASGLGVAYGNFANDPGDANFSAMRHHVLEEREEYMSLQRYQIESFENVVYNAWLETSLLARAITTPRGAPLRVTDLDRYRSVEFHGRKWRWVDILKEAQAYKLLHDMKAMSLSMIIRDLGFEPDDVWKEIEKERATMEARGIDPNEVLGPAGINQDTVTGQSEAA